MRTPGSARGQDLGRAPLVRRIGVAVQEADGDALDALRLQGVGKRRHRGLVERQPHAALGVDALGHGEAERARHQRLGLLDEDVVLLEAVLLRHLDRIAEALGGDQCGLRALALDDGVGGEGRAVHDQADLAGLDLGKLQRAQHAVEHAVLGRGLGGQHLGRKARLGRLQHDVGEGPADIDRKADGFRRNGRRHGVLLQSGVTSAPRPGSDRSRPGSVNRNGSPPTCPW